jgi:cyanophycinase
MHAQLTEKGYLFLIGGAEDRNGDRHVLKYLVDQTNPASITIIPTASAFPKDAHRCYADVFSQLGVKRVHCLDIRYRNEADRCECLEAVEDTDLIYFSGGDQAKLVKTLKDTRLFAQIKARFENGGLHIAGTSAGASSIGDPIFYNGERRGLKKGSIKISQGFGFIKDIAIDTHFSARKRLARLCQFLLSGKCKRGIGLDEDTGIIVFPNLHFEVIGSGMVVVVSSAHVTGSNYSEIQKGESLRFNNMCIGYLPPGTRFSMKKWSILTHCESP